MTAVMYPLVNHGLNSTIPICSYCLCSCSISYENLRFSLPPHNWAENVARGRMGYVNLSRLTES